VGEFVSALVDWLGRYGYPVLFAVVFAENAGLPVPGETAVLLSGLIAGRPESHLSIVWVIVVTFVAAVLGDNLGFWLGRRWARRRLEQGKRFLFLTPQGLQSVEGYFEHYGLLTIFFARFVTGLRVVAAVAAGTSRLSWGKFLLANAAGAVAWSTTMALLGYFFGQSWELLHKWVGRGALFILACVIVLVGLPYLYRRLRRLPAGSWDRLLRSQVWQGLLAALLVVVCVALLVALYDRHAHPMGEDEAFRQWAEDVGVSEWVTARRGTWVDGVATAGSYLGSLPVTAGVTALAVLGLWYAGRPGREWGAAIWALAASEGVGLLLLALIRHRGLEPARALAWPFGFAGLEPLRASAVYGMLAHLVWRHNPRWKHWAGVGAILVILLVGFAGIWSHAQRLTEVLVEYVAGSLVLFLGLWWLEGYGLGPRPGPTPAEPPAAEPARVP
jgi:membrane-associated protein